MGNYDNRGTVRPAVAISSGQSLSAAIGPLKQLTVMKLIFDGWTSAAVSFEVSADGENYVPLCDADGELSLADPSGVNGGAVAIALDPAVFAGWAYLKVRSGTNGSAVNQGADRSIVPIVREVA